MSNEVLFILFFIILCIINISAFKAWKIYGYSLIGIYTILMNIFVTKQFFLFGFAITWWNALYWATFLLTDLLSEHYWKKAAFKAVIIWFVSMLLFVISTQFLILLSPNEYDYAQSSIETLFWIAPRILLWSLLAYFIAQNIDVFLFHKIKKVTHWKYLWLRNNLSTLISQAFDTLIFTFVWLTSIWWITWVIDIELFWEVAFATYIIKIIVTFIDTPFMYWWIWLKNNKRFFATKK